MQIAARAGVSSGSVAAGLVGNTRLVFDLWGEPVDEAFALGHAATAQQVVVGPAARDRMPSGFELSEVDLDGAIAWVYEASSTSRGVT